MKTYEIDFKGRKVGAIGVFETFRTQVFADDPEAAKLALYARFEHITLTREPKEIQSPFDAEGLVNRVQNERDEHRSFRSKVEALRDLLDLVATRQAKANADWHDDPDSDDHGLYHSPADQQFTREERDKALLELVARHLEVLKENEVAA